MHIGQGGLNTLALDHLESVTPIYIMGTKFTLIVELLMWEIKTNIMSMKDHCNSQWSSYNRKFTIQNVGGSIQDEE
jgi:hypothetical protein